VRALGDDEGADDIRTVPDPPTTLPAAIGNGSVGFSADSAGGDSLTDPLDHATAETQERPMDVYVTGSGEPTRRIISSGTVERCPTFSPDGRRLAYIEAPAVDDGDGRVAPSIVVVPVGAGGAPGPAELRVPLPVVVSNHLLRSLGRIPCPAWSPDGARLAYLVTPPDEVLAPRLVPGARSQHFAELHVLGLDGRDRVINTENLAYQDGRFAWSPDSDAIAYPAADGAWIAPIDGSGPTLALPTDATPVWDTGESFGMPLRTMATAVAWPSRGQLAVTILASTLENADYSLHLVDLATGGDRTLELTSNEAQQVVAWSPDGSRVAYVLDDGTRTVAVLDLATGRMIGIPTRLDDGTELPLRLVGWSPDGERLLGIAAVPELGYALVSLSADGSAVDVLTPWSWAFEFTDVRDVTWQPATHGG
jgi:Tol biopolymer transport system component